MLRMWYFLNSRHQMGICIGFLDPCLSSWIMDFFFIRLTRLKSSVAASKPKRIFDNISCVSDCQRQCCAREGTVSQTVYYFQLLNYSSKSVPLNLPCLGRSSFSCTMRWEVNSFREKKLTRKFARQEVITQDEICILDMRRRSLLSLSSCAKRVYWQVFSCYTPRSKAAL
jgi:hypothetical protein